MNVIIFCLPLVVAIFLLLFFRKRVVWWEYLLLIIPSIAISFFIEFCLKDFNSNDTEYLGYHMTKITHYDHWNEYIHKTCTREVEIGRDSSGKPIYKEEEYDCSYVEDHPERWKYTLNDDSEHYFNNADEFYEVKHKFNAPMVFRDMHRNYHTIDGDAQDYFWDGSFDKVESVTFPHSYENRLKSSKSIHKLTPVSKEEAAEYDLFDYPECKDRKQNVVLGINLPESQTKYIDNLNALFGKDKQIRLYMLFFKDKSPDIAELQRCYWQNGNKNEVVVCVGYDSKTNKVTWADGFSWSDVPLIENESKQYFLENHNIDLKGYYDHIVPFVKLDWKRKSFADFKYINVELSWSQYVMIFIVTALYNILMSLYIILNNYRNNERSSKCP